MYSHHFESAHYANNVHLCRYMLYGFEDLETARLILASPDVQVLGPNHE